MAKPFAQIRFKRTPGAGFERMERGSWHQIASQYVSLRATKRDVELAKRTAEIAREIVAVDTGKTRDSIEANGKMVTAEYGAPYLEFGTIKMDAQPFLRPATKQAVKEWSQRNRKQ